MRFDDQVKVRVFDKNADVAGCHVSCKGTCCTPKPNEVRRNSFEGLPVEETNENEAEVQDYPEPQVESK